MATKLGRNEIPAGHTRNDFECFGPVVTEDTKFSGCKLAEFGCFKQDEGTDSNKFYLAAVVRSKKDNKWYLYVEYGRTKDGAPDKPQFQFTPCASEAEACAEFVKQCDAKNTKRGTWEKVGSKERYVPKVKKDGSTEDLYVVRYMATRAVGLPAGYNICNAGSLPVAASKVAGKKATKYDEPTRRLFRDLLGGAISYTKSTMIGGTVPAQSAIDDARDLLFDALRRLKYVGNNITAQVADAELKKLTYALYGMIPKAKAHGAVEADWILSQGNIGAWQNDLDAFETALKSGNVETSSDDQIMYNIPADMEWVNPSSDLGKWLYEWWGSTAGNAHKSKKLRVHNIWKVVREGDDSEFTPQVEATAKQMPATWKGERPRHIEKQAFRPDLTAAQRKQHWNANVALLYHGSRSVNVPGIIRENFRFPNELKSSGVVINAAMFGGGTYTADTWGKSANYCSLPQAAYNMMDGHVKGRHAFMFACDTILGNPYVAKKSEGFTKPPEGHHCVLGKGGYTVSNYGNTGTLLNNEWVIYRKGRIVIRFLAEVSMV